MKILLQSGWQLKGKCIQKEIEKQRVVQFFENSSKRKLSVKYPIFIVGSGRCGTTLLYHMILSSGGFAVYRAETHVFTLLPPYFGDLRKDSNRKKLMKYWVNSVLFQRSGLNPSQWSKQAWNLCFTYADLLVFLLESIAKQPKV